MTDQRAGRVAVIGGGITGAAAAFEAASSAESVTLFEADDRVGGKMASTPFAGVAHVDAAADAFLARVPDAVALAAEVGIGDELVHPEKVGAAVWYDRMHDIPDGLVLGVPGNPFALARSGLLTWRGKARAALEPFLPRTSLAPDSIGAFVRARFGDEVHERLVDALVGSIYAADTDRFSLAEIPQLAALSSHRSLLLGARRIAAKNAGTASATAAPIFAAPAGGMPRLTDATVEAARQRGADVRLGASVTAEPDGSRWRVAGDVFDAVVIAAPPRTLANTLPGADLGATIESASADVVMVTLHVDDGEWPERFTGRSGYLVPKPVQLDVTAVSFGSQKWAHWTPPSGGQVLRVSVGRDGAPVLHLSDEEIVERVLADLHRHLGVAFSPLEVRITRWPGAFAQYRPHHRARVDDLRSHLPDGIFVAGAGYDGIGIPACIRSGRTNAEHAARHARSLAS
jgi:protoporphyrinogen/coproporphyrinogen III oxidase